MVTREKIWNTWVNEGILHSHSCLKWLSFLRFVLAFCFLYSWCSGHWSLSDWENLPFLTNFRGSSLSKAPHSRTMLCCLRAYATVTSLPTDFTLWSKILLTKASQTGDQTTEDNHFWLPGLYFLRGTSRFLLKPLPLLFPLPFRQMYRVLSLLKALSDWSSGLALWGS